MKKKLEICKTIITKSIIKIKNVKKLGKKIFFYNENKKWGRSCAWTVTRIKVFLEKNREIFKLNTKIIKIFFNSK